MAKSIRSKIKRKHRAEFRSTIGNDAYQVNLTKVNANLQKSIERQSMSEETIDKLHNLLGNDDDGDFMGDESAAIDASETTKPIVPARGENKVTARLTPSKRSKRRKHKMDGQAMKLEKAEKAVDRKHRYHCEF